MASPLTDLLLGYVVCTLEASAYQGGLLVVTGDGDPVDFVYSTPVTLTQLQRVLLGKRADAHVIAKVLAVPLLEKANEKPNVLFFDEASLLLRTISLPAPAVVLAVHSAPHKDGEWKWRAFEGAADGSGVWAQSSCLAHVSPVLAHARATMAPLTLGDPLQQLRAALAEVRKAKGAQ